MPAPPDGDCPSSFRGPPSLPKKHWRQTPGATNFNGTMKRIRTFAAVAALLLSALAIRPAFAADEPRSAITRPPAVPLVTHDPYFSCWSFADHLYDDWPKHWT